MVHISFFTEKPKIASLERSLIYANIGDEVLLPCDVSGSPKPRFKWVRRGGNFDLKNSRFEVMICYDTLYHFLYMNISRTKRPQISFYQQFCSTFIKECIESPSS